MTFKEYVEALVKELGVEVETEDDACAFSLGSEDGDKVEILLQGIDTRGALLMYTDLGEPPPEGREKLFQTLLEANDIFADTAGATLSLDRRTGHVRLQRCDDMDALVTQGASSALTAFADTASVWKRLIADFRAALPKESNGSDAPFDAIRV